MILGHHKCTYTAKPTSAEYRGMLGAVTLTIRTGAVDLNDYLSADDASQLVAALQAAILGSREEQHA